MSEDAKGACDALVGLTSPRTLFREQQTLRARFITTGYRTFAAEAYCRANPADRILYYRAMLRRYRGFRDTP